MNNYNIIVLGPSGSGKTVFLASMYKRLSTQNSEIGFFIETNPDARKRLVEKYFEVATAGSWPPGTRDVSIWNFTCCVRPPGGIIHRALQFTYLDYAGGRLTDVQEDANNSDTFERQLEEADALLGVLDGQRILALMEGKPEGNNFLFLELPNILNIMQRNNNPIHFVITKWDILQERFSLREIRDRLLQVEEFRNLVNDRIKDSHVRLIPVSSVGMGFAKLQKDGSMLKMPGMLPNPFQVNVPLCCVLPDKFMTEMSKLAEREKQLRQQIYTPSKPKLTFWDNMGMLVGYTFRTVRGFLKGMYELDEMIFGKLISFAESSTTNKRENYVREADRLREERDASLKAVQNEQTAIQHAVNSFLYIVRKLDIEFPESDLSRLR